MNCSDPSAHPGCAACAAIDRQACAAAGRQAVIALGRGGYGTAAQAELGALCEQLRVALPRTHVASAYVDRASPSLPEALDACLQACSGITQIIIQPMFVPVDNALLRWLEKVARRWRHRQPDAAAAIRIVFAPPLGSLDGLGELLARHIGEAARRPDVTQTTPDRWQSDPIGWSSVPAHQRHVLLCTGPRCNALGATALWSHLIQALRRSDKLQKTVIVLQTGCQFPCNHGPLMIVYPEGLWYGRLDTAAIDHIVDRHLDQGTVADAYRVHGPIEPSHRSHSS